MKLQSETEYITFSEVAEKLRVTPEAVIYWHQVGVKRDRQGEPIRLEAIRPGRKYLTTWEAVQKFVDRREAGLTMKQAEKEKQRIDDYYEAQLQALLNS